MDISNINGISTGDILSIWDMCRLMQWLKRLSGSRRYFQFMIRPQRLHGHLKKLQKDFWIMNLLLWMRKEQSHMFFQIFLTESNS